MTRFKIVVIILLLILTIRFIIFYNQKNNYQDGQVIRFDTTLVYEPQFFPGYQKFTVNLSTGKSIFVTAPFYPQYQYADKVSIYGNLKVRVIKNKSIYSLYFPKIEAVKSDKGLLLAITSFIRQSVTALFNKILPPDLSSLLLGIVFGIKGPMSKEFINNLRLAGVMHVIAASGMNITMVAGFLSSIFMLFLKRQTAAFCKYFGNCFLRFVSGHAAVNSACIDNGSYGFFLTNFRKAKFGSIWTFPGRIYNAFYLSALKND